MAPGDCLQLLGGFRRKTNSLAISLIQYQNFPFLDSFDTEVQELKREKGLLEQDEKPCKRSLLLEQATDGWRVLGEHVHA